jgi:hypothetical protein
MLSEWLCYSWLHKWVLVAFWLNTPHNVKDVLLSRTIVRILRFLMRQINHFLLRMLIWANTRQRTRKSLYLQLNLLLLLSGSEHLILWNYFILRAQFRFFHPLQRTLLKFISCLLVLGWDSNLACRCPFVWLRLLSLCRLGLLPNWLLDRLFSMLRLFQFKVDEWPIQLHLNVRFEWAWHLGCLFCLVLHCVELTEHLVCFLGLVVKMTFQVQLFIFEEHS